MPAFITHLCLSAARVVAAGDLSAESAILARGVALALRPSEGLDTLAACRSLLHERGWPLRAVAVQWDVRRPPDADQLNHWLVAIGDVCDLLLLRLSSSDPHDKPSAPRALPAGAHLLQHCSRLAGQRLRIALTPTPQFWLADEHDAVRLAMRVNRANVGVVLNWDSKRAADETFADLLRLVMPKLHAVMAPLQKVASPADWLARFDPEEMRVLTNAGYRGPVFFSE